MSRITGSRELLKELKGESIFTHAHIDAIILDTACKKHFSEFQQINPDDKRTYTQFKKEFEPIIDRLIHDKAVHAANAVNGKVSAVATQKQIPTSAVISTNAAVPAPAVAPATVNEQTPPEDMPAEKAVTKSPSIPAVAISDALSAALRENKKMTASDIGAFLANTAGKDAASLALIKSALDSVERERKTSELYGTNSISRFISTGSKTMSPALVATESKDNEFLSISAEFIAGAVRNNGARAAPVMVLAPLTIDESVKTWWKNATDHQKDKYVEAHVISSIDEATSQITTASGDVFGVSASCMQAVIKGPANAKQVRATTHVNTPYTTTVAGVAITALPIKAELQTLGVRATINAAVNYKHPTL
jgi:hypothetical protein